MLLNEEHLWVYKAKLVRVVDGDTVVLEVDRGFEDYSKMKFRLVRVDTPELKTEEGKAVKQFVTEWFQGSDFVLIKSHKKGKFGRYLAEVYKPGDNKSLSDVLLANGMADPYPKKK